MRSQVSRGILAEESSVWEGACLATILCQLITQIYLVLARKRMCLERALIILGFSPSSCMKFLSAFCLLSLPTLF